MNAQRGRLAKKQAQRHRRERVAGIVLAIVGVAVAVVAVVALNNPRDGGGTSNAAASTGVPASASTPSPGSATASPSASASTPSTGHSQHTIPVDLGSDDSSADADAKATPLVVLNNTTVTGLAAQAARRFEQGGWTVTDSGNLTNDILSTCAYYDPDTDGAKAAAQALQEQYPTIKRVEPKFPELPDGPVVVVLTPDYQPG